MTGLKNLINSINNKGKTSREYLTISRQGRYILRILQNVHDENEAPFEVFTLHRIYHPLYKRETSLRCIGHGCPLCANAKNEERIDRANAWRYKATDYYIYNVIERQTGQLKILKLSYVAHEAIKAKLVEAAMEGVNIGHFKNGRDLEIEVREVAGKLKYKAYILSESETKPIPAKIIEEIKLVKPLNEMYRLHTKQELIDILGGKAPELPQYEKKKLSSKASLIENLNKKKQPIKEEVKLEKENKSSIDEKLSKLGIFEGDDNE